MTNIIHENREVSLSQLADNMDIGSNINAAFQNRANPQKSRVINIESILSEIKSKPVHDYRSVKEPDYGSLNTIARLQSSNVSAGFNDDQSPVM
ncbi:MAG: hypothetical protein QM504_06750 [Pseudomonadota bacterium]